MLKYLLSQIENMNNGFLALFVVGLLFICLQVWWIGMTINNGRGKNLPDEGKLIDLRKKQLEKIFNKKL